jgi:hypothetical protein
MLTVDGKRPVKRKDVVLMVKVSVEVRSGTARFSVAVRTASIRRAVSFVEERYPTCDVRVRSPVGTEGFFVKDSVARAGVAGFQQPDKIAA